MATVAKTIRLKKPWLLADDSKAFSEKSPFKEAVPSEQWIIYSGWTSYSGQQLIDITDKKKYLHTREKNVLSNIFFNAFVAEDDSSHSDILPVFIDGDIVCELPLQLEALYNAIEKSKYILDLQDNWDDEGSQGYTKETWYRAIQFIGNYAKWILNCFDTVIDTPKISHGPDGSIDILWKKATSYRMLINIPADNKQPGSFYGDDYKLLKVQGTFDPQEQHQIPFLLPHITNSSNVGD